MKAAFTVLLIWLLVLNPFITIGLIIAYTYIQMKKQDEREEE